MIQLFSFNINPRSLKMINDSGQLDLVALKNVKMADDGPYEPLCIISES